MHKKNIKRVIIVLFVFFLSGCKVEYNLDISDNKIVESSNIFANLSDLNDYNRDVENPISFEEYIDNYYDQDYRAFVKDFDDTSIYKKKKIDDSDMSGVNLKFVYNYNNFGNSYLFNFNNVDKYSTFVNSQNIIVIDVRDLNYYYNLDYFMDYDSLVVNIKTKLKVLENNADRVHDNVYTWKLKKGKKEKKRVYIKIDKGKNTDDNYTMFIVIVPLLVIACFVSVILYIRKKNAENNSI